MYKELTKEQNLVVLGSRLTFNDKDIMDLNSLLKEKNRVDFFEFLKLSIYHKTFVLCMDNIMKYGASFRIPSYLYMQYVFLKNGYEQRNRLMRSALDEFQKQCEEKSVTIIPVKGAYLLNEIYTDQSVRYQGDIDILFDHDDIERITILLKENGYTAGRYDLKNNILQCRIVALFIEKGCTGMAITKILRRKSRVDKLIAYALNPAKTENGSLTAHIHCSDGYAAREMQAVRENWDAEQGTQAFHIIQSFAPGEITPELALQLAQEFAQEHLQGYQVVIGTHCDHAHIHNHIVFNAVSFVDGKKYHSTPQTYYRQVRAISDRLCREHGLSVVMEDGERRRGMSYAEWKAVQDGGLSLRQVVARDVREVLSYALDYGEFLALMEGKGYEIRHGKYLSFRPYGYERFIRPQLDGVKCTENAIRAHIEGELENPTAQVLVPKPYRPYPKPVVGVIGIYRHWLYVLGFYAKHKGPPQQSALLRSELRHFERYKTQHCYLVQHRIVTGEDLQKHQEELNGRLQALTRTRTILNTQKKRKGKLYTALATVEQFSPVADLLSEGSIGTEEERCGWKEANELLNGQDVDALKSQKAQLYNQIAEVNRQMRELRKELAMCDTIRTTESALRERMNGFAEIEQGRIQVRSLPDDRDGFPGL